MTQSQFAALRSRCDKQRVFDELRGLDHLAGFKRGANCKKAHVAKWLRNGWNTESRLRVNADRFTDEALRNSLHWAFPQAYYSAFTVTLAYFQVAGFSHTAHAKVLWKVGYLMRRGRYPNVVSFLADGGMSAGRTFHNVSKHIIPFTTFFDSEDPDTWETQIAQFLNATRQDALKEWKRRVKIKTKPGNRKTSFSADDWEQVSRHLGATSILSLLYRKRLKANYEDIETLLADELNPEFLYEDLIHVLTCLNLVHETFVAKGLGLTRYRELLSPGRSYPFVTKRLAAIQRILAN